VQQTTSIGDLGSARALQAARAGVEWGAYTVLRTPADAFVTGCQAGAATKTLTFAGTNLNEYTTTLTCTSSGSLAEGADTVRVYLLIANACNSPLAGACPNAGTTAATYVEREVSATVGCRGASCL
jgi:MSHA biogenesis protein MshP